MYKTTVVIKTIGRPTLANAVRSAKREGFKPIIVSDGAPLTKKMTLGCQHIVLGKQWGYYGGMVTNVGAAMCSTEYMTLLDDDDEFILGAGDIIRSKIKEDPEVDVWIGGVRFQTPIAVLNKGKVVNESSVLAINPELGVNVGNVAMPTYRVSIFERIPFVNILPDDRTSLTDYFHIKQCEAAGYKIDWFGQAIYDVRPTKGEFDVNGGGK